jgi:hypothetical protein
MNEANMIFFIGIVTITTIVLTIAPIIISKLHNETEPKHNK